MDDKTFDNHSVVDTYGQIPILKLDDLPKKDLSLPIDLTMIISFTNYRREQLARSLETIARQKFRNFEILICDIGSTQDMESVYQIYEPYLRIKTKRIERSHFSADVSRGIFASLPDVSGKVIATMQPEMMLHPDCFDYLYYSHFQDMPDNYKFGIEKPDNFDITDKETYVNIRNGFLSSPSTRQLNDVNWHDDILNLERMPDYWTHGECLSNWTNAKHLEWLPHKKWIWWFVSSAKKESTIWQDIPNADGHAFIDFYFIWYRKYMGYVDIVPQKTLAYHQEHVRASISPNRDNWVQNQEEFKLFLRNKGRKLYGEL